MHECSIIELEDFGFNHLVHHLDDSEFELFGYSEEFDCIDMIAECAEEIIWK